MSGDGGGNETQSRAAESAARSRSKQHPGDFLLHPVALGALVALVFNDHVAKDRWPSAATGKLSDVAGLVFFPLLLVSSVEVARRAMGRDRWVLGRSALILAVITTALGFAAIKVWGPAGDAYRIANGLARWPLDAVPAVVRGHGLPPVESVGLVEDRTDLVALGALVAPLWIGTHVTNQREQTRRS